MRQKYTLTVAGIQMNISCDETQEAVNAAVNEVDTKMKELLANVSHCNKTEAALLLALDYCTRGARLAARVAELEDYINAADPNGDNYGASLLRGENEALRAELQASRGMNDALLQDNATLFGLHKKSEKQSADATARADRMHDQVLALVSEVQDLRGRLARACVETPAPSEQFGEIKPIEPVTLSDEEQGVADRYAQMDVGHLAK